MEMHTLWPWLALVGLGAAHGLNPGMGWLFAVALGLQEQKRAAVLTAIACLAAGHALAVGAAVAIAAALGVVLPFSTLKWVVAATLLTLGIAQLVWHAHPRYGSMRVGPRQITIWSFLMATAHGAGLMVLPLVLGLRRTTGAAGSGATTAGESAVAGVAHAHDHGAAHAHSGHAHSAHDALLAGAAGEQTAAVLATVVHTAGYLVVTALLAILVYEKLGLRMLGKVWINVRVIWAVALIVTALLTPLIA